MKKDNLVNSLLLLNDKIIAIVNGDFKLEYNKSNLDKKDINNIVEGFKKMEKAKNSFMELEDNEIELYKIILLERVFFYAIQKYEDNEKKLGLYDKYFFNFAQKVPSGMAIIKDKKVVFRNSILLGILGLESEDIYTQPWEKLNIQDKENVKRVIEGEIVGPIEIYVDFNKNDPKWLLINAVHSKLSGSDYVIFLMSDITTQKQNELEFKKEKERLYLTFESTNDAVIATDRDNNIVLFNKEASRLTGYTKEEAIGKQVNKILFLINEAGHVFDYLELDSYKDTNLILESKNKSFRFIVFKISKVRDIDESVQGNVILVADVSDQKRKEKEILYLSYHDVLTGLHNRTFFEEQIKILNTPRQLPLSIIMGDVNGLKLTNDVFGHDAGDMLLRNVAKVLKNTCRSEDIIARWGGDEFIILLPQTSEIHVNLVMNRIIAKIEKMFSSDNTNTIMPSLALGYGIKTQTDEEIYEVIRIAETNMYKRKMLTSSSVYSSIIGSMKSALYERSNETEEHSERLYQLCSRVAERYKLSENDMSDLELFCMLHDIGKIGISDDILNKKGKLSSKEWEEMKKHPEIGYRIAQSSKELMGVSNYILSHHERFDGSGYPRKLVSFDIPLLARILSVADAFDAMTHDRVYQSKISEKDALIELQDNAGTQFDPEIVRIFLEVNK